MTNYYEEIMPVMNNEDDYLKYYFDDTTPLFDKLNNIVKKGQPIQRQALLKNLIIYEKESLFKSLITFIINSLPVCDIETALCFPKSIYVIITNVDYIMDKELFSIIFKHMITSLSSGFERARNEYLFYFNKIIEFYSVIDIKNNNQIKPNFFPYKINEEIIKLIIELGVFGQTPQNRKLCCYLCSSICRIYYNGKENPDIKKLYERISYLFWDVEKTTEAQMARELLYIIPLFYEEMFKSDDIIQAVQSYINHDSDHVIQVMAIISLLKNIKYLNKKSENCGCVFNLLMNKIKEIIEDFDYGSIYKNIILHVLINTLYTNYIDLNISFLYPVFQFGIMKNYYNFYKLDIMFIKDFYKYSFLINFFLENAQNLENKYNENCNKNEFSYKMLLDQINSQINFEAYFIKIINELFDLEENNINDDDAKENDSSENFEENENLNDDNNCLLNLLNFDGIINDKLNVINNNLQSNNNKEKNNFDVDNLIYDEFFLDKNIDIIFNNKKENENLQNYIYNKNILKKMLYLYLPKIIGCFNSLQSNKSLGEKLLFLFDKKNTEFNFNIYYTSMEYLIERNKNKTNTKNKNILKKHALYELLLFLIKKNSQIIKHQGKTTNKNSNANNNINNIASFEGNIYNKLFTNILSTFFSVLNDLKGDKKNKSLFLIGKILKLLIPKIYKYFKNISYDKIINYKDLSISANLSLNNYKDSSKNYYYEKIFEDIFNELISKVINNHQNLGHHIIKEYIELIPILILYSKEKRKFYNFFIKEILVSDSFYMRKFTLIFYEQCFSLFSMSYLIKYNFFSDFCLLFKDKVNLISTNSIELVFKYSKKIISYSKEKFLAVCQVLHEVYNSNVESLNNKNNEIIFDSDKNIIINKIINISNNIDNYFSEQELDEEKENENQLSNKENNICKQHSLINIKSSSHEDNIGNIENLTYEENTKINSFQSSKLIPHNHRYDSITNNNTNQNKRIINILSLSQKAGNGKLIQNIEKPLKLNKENKEKGKNLSSKCNNFLKNKFNKENKRTNNELINSVNLNSNTPNINNKGKRHNSMITKNAMNSKYKKHLLPKLKEHEIKIFEKDNTTQNIKSENYSLGKYKLLSDKKNIVIDSKNSTADSKERIPSSKIRIMKSSFPIINKDCSLDIPNLNLENSDEKKNNININCNLRYSINYGLEIVDKNININNKQISVTLRPRSKIMKLNKNSFIKSKIYIDANK